MSTEPLRLIESKLSRLRTEHENRLLFLSGEPLKTLNPTRRATVGEAVTAYADAVSAELSRYIDLIRTETLSLAEQLLVPLSDETVSSVIDLVQRQFDRDLYPKRFKLFEEALDRQGKRFGIRISDWGVRTDIKASLHQVETGNRILRFIPALRDDLQLLRLTKRTDRPQPAREPGTRLEQANRIVKLEPNVFGIGINLNYLIRRLLGKKE